METLDERCRLKNDAKLHCTNNYCDFTFELTMAVGFSGKICALSRCFSIRLGLSI
jgi:hypothetical protein